MCSGIDLAAIEGEIDLGTGITDNEFRLLEADQKRKKLPGDIDLVPYGLRADSETGVALSLSRVDSPSSFRVMKTCCVEPSGAPR